jgi:hypothetical protein
MVFIKSKLGNVIDVRGNSTAPGALLDAYPQKADGNDNQQWDFVADPGGSGCFFIKSKLGNVIDILGNSTAAGTGLDSWPQKTTANKNQLWSFVPDPAGSGSFFIISALNGNVIDVKGASSAAGTGLDAWPRKASDYDNQLWSAMGGTFPGPCCTGISWGPEGTGPAPNSSTVCSGGNECAYQVSLSVNQDGACTFSGYYQNRGDVWWGTAPPQAFVVAFLIYDTFGNGYSFAYSGEIPSAPQSGSLVTWNKSVKSQVIANNWYAIAAKNWGGAYVRNNYDESVLQVVESWWPTIEQGIKEAGSILLQIIEAAGEDGGGAADLNSDQMVMKNRPPLPAGVPTRAAASAGQSLEKLIGIRR